MSMNGPKFSKSDRTMKAFSFVERNNCIIRSGFLCVIVGSGCALVNHHEIEISSSQSSCFIEIQIRFLKEGFFFIFSYKLDTATTLVGLLVGLNMPYLRQTSCLQSIG